jgi:DNA/RNA-binding domain of Phe-tRNA-synthetase-like protein
MPPGVAIAVAPDLAAVVAAPARAIDDVVVRAHDPALDEPLGAAVDRGRRIAEAPEITAAVRAMYRRVGLDPTKTRPSSEALLRRVRRGDPLPRINSLVDVINWCSLESQLPFGLYDRARISGGVTLRLGAPGEEYAGIRKDVVHLAGRLTLADAEGPFGNPTSDSARAMVTPATTHALIVVFAPAALAREGERAADLAVARAGQYCR